MTTSEELFLQSSRPMKEPKDDTIHELPTKPITYQEAEYYLGKLTPEGRVLGVTSRPGINYKEGVYLVISQPPKESKYVLVGD